MLGGSFDTHDIVVAYLNIFLEPYKTKNFKEKNRVFVRQGDVGALTSYDKNPIFFFENFCSIWF